MQGFLAAQLKAARAGSFLDDGAPIRRTEREYLIDEALTYDDEGVIGEVRAREQVL